MLCQILLLHILSLDKVSGSQLENVSDEKEVDVIYFPYPYGPEEKIISNAVLSVDLNELTNFSVCFAFMVDGLVDVATHPAINSYIRTTSLACGARAGAGKNPNYAGKRQVYLVFSDKEHV